MPPVAASLYTSVSIFQLDAMALVTLTYIKKFQKTGKKKSQRD